MGDGLACESLGGLARGLDGSPQPTDVTRGLREAIPFYRKACDLGATRGCGWVAGAITDGFTQGALKDAFQLYVKACNGPDKMPVACRAAVSVLHQGTAESRELAAEYDLDRLSVELLKRGCKLGDAQACELLPNPNSN
jgi:TPR repeat protein